MLYHITIASFSAGTAGVLTCWLLLWTIFQGNKAKGFFLMVVLIILLVSTYLCWVFEDQVFLATLPWIWFILAAAVFRWKAPIIEVEYTGYDKGSATTPLPLNVVPIHRTD